MQLENLRIIKKSTRTEKPCAAQTKVRRNLWLSLEVRREIQKLALELRATQSSLLASLLENGLKSADTTRLESIHINDVGLKADKCFFLPSNLMDELKFAAKQKGMGVSECAERFIRISLEDYLNDVCKEKGQ